ncbi:hypothetical protein LTR99_007311 [Exophiala xenobiotica]|uniref:Protein kinase domain-containing protein n=1 Tax=Vermiconidia calcicola TaxID=1690605 RepID=A0AAV9Q2A5_9PEZI|nr:hypothetical protein LTR41_006927 [Exophiala xenobiotica]KAK5534420.1 hypothetical protein LTR25_006452 [Vermiconidia calcicola]KAK5536131.1 hypothetical protein LTR23_008152 [Chaetothyriales sp. CCFEE 6169]KAK5228011.1 hypothetical protein LTR72_001894 [Exophiala xenobiotica]KAK5238917.1 hypothetical protein LTR47_000660 [Exophiala xenobiotica]
MTDSRLKPSIPPPPESRTRNVQDDLGQYRFPRHQDQTNEPGVWAEDRFLLTPPVQTHNVDPMEEVIYQNNARAFQANQQAFSQNSQLSAFPEHSHQSHRDATHLLSGLHIRTDGLALKRTNSTQSIDSEPRLRSSSSASSIPIRIPNIRAHLHSSAGSVSPGTTISSPQIAAMLDITPLPSPTVGTFESLRALSRTRSRGSSISSFKSLKVDMLPPAFPSTTYSNLSPTSPRRKGYPGLKSPPRSHLSDEQDAQNEDAHPRSVSDYVPEALAVPKPRHVAVSTTGPPPGLTGESSMHREEFIGPDRRMSKPHLRPSTPPRVVHEAAHSYEDEPAAKRPRFEVFHAKSITTGEPRSYEAIRVLGQGTFSKVYLAVRLIHKDRKDSVDYRQESMNMAGVKARSRRLVAVKVVEHGPAGGADAERIEIGLKREVEILKSIHHPCLVHLKAFGNDGHARALLVMNYCPGGDLFEVATKHREVLVPKLVRRIFSELVSATRYLHQKFIVHRDIKLENVLLNIPVRVHSDVANWQTLDRAVVTLTDMGLSRRIPEPPESPLLSTRCGSEDYAAPEILMGQPYDGRQTDAWALGVLLYALMEGRLPFDPLPGARGDPATLRARTPHRIARCEWAWVKFGDEDGDWDADKGKDFEGANACVDALLKRNTRRKPLAEIREMAWVKDGIQVDGGLRWVEEETL